MGVLDSVTFLVLVIGCIVASLIDHTNMHTIKVLLSYEYKVITVLIINVTVAIIFKFDTIRLFFSSDIFGLHSYLNAILEYPIVYFIQLHIVYILICGACIRTLYIKKVKFYDYLDEKW